jgi:hypothetical protein
MPRKARVEFPGTVYHLICRDSKADPFSFRHGDRDRYINAHGHSNGDGHRHSYGNSHGDRHRHTDSDRHPHGDTCPALGSLLPCHDTRLRPTDAHSILPGVLPTAAVRGLPDRD